MLPMVPAGSKVFGTAKARRATGGKECEVARHRYQTGCLFKRGKRNKVWVARWREDVIQPDGSPGRMHRTVVLGLVSEIPTRRQARTLLDERLRPLNQGLRRPQSTMGFRHFALGDWTNAVWPTLKFSTQRGYRLVLGRHLLPYFGDWRLCDISKLQIQRFVVEKFRQGLAWQTVRNVWIVLSSILDSAVEYRFLVENPARGVRFPPQPPRREPEILAPESFLRLLDRLREPFKSMVALAALTGIRIGELLALRWRAVDLGSGILHVCESVYEGKFQRPKSKKGTRMIPIGPLTRYLLENHCQRSQRLKPDDLVFPNRRGRPFQGRNLLRRELQPAGQAAGIGRVTWHQFRHIHATLLHDLGAPAKVAQQQLGHATVETTLNVYTHVIQDTHRRAIENLERVLFPNGPKLVDSDEGCEFVIQ